MQFGNPAKSVPLAGPRWPWPSRRAHQGRQGWGCVAPPRRPRGMPRPSRPWKTAARLDRVAAGRPFGPAGSPAGRPARPGPAPGFHGTRRCSSLPLRDPHSRSFCYPGAYTRSGQGRHRRSSAARDWNCSSLRCPRRVAGSVPEARASQSLAHRPLHPIRNGPVAFSDEGLSLITAWLQVRVLPAPPRSPAQLEFSPSPRNTLDFPRFGAGALARSRSL